MKKVRIGILGCANIAKKNTIQAFQALKSAEVISIASRSSEKAKLFATQFNIPTVQSYDELLHNPTIDAIYIPLPIGLHEEWIIKAASLGKHVLSEKSLTTDFTSAKKIITHCKNKQIVLYENFMCDFHPQHEKVIATIFKGEIGKPFLFNGKFGIPMLHENNFRYNHDLGGSALYETGAYTVFMARKIFNCEPVAVDAQLTLDREKNIDMKGVAQLIFTDEKIAHIAFSLDNMYQNNYSVWGQEGLINVNRAYAIPATMTPDVTLTKNENFTEITTSIAVSAANHFELIFHDFCQTIINKESSQIKINEIYTKMLFQAKILEAIKISSREKRRVLLSQIK